MKLPALLLIVSLLWGCGHVPALFTGDESRQLADLLAWSQRVAQSTPEVQRKELSGASQAFGREPGTLARLRLALLLAKPGSAIADDSRAASLLEPFAASGEDAGPLRQFGSVLHAQVSERQKEQKRSQQYREQIEALRDVERSLRERGQAKGK